MTMKTIALAAVLTGIALSALASDHGERNHRERYQHGRYEHGEDRARCPAVAATERLSVQQVTQKLEEEGYTVRRIRASHGCYEVKATDANGARVEMYVDPVTAKIIGHGDRS